MNAPYHLDKRAHNNATMAALKQERTSWESTLRDIGDHIAPYSHEFVTTDSNDGRRRDSEIINNTPTDSLEIATSGLVDSLCNSTEQWFGLEAVDRNLNKLHSVRMYCEEVTETLLSEKARSNFYQIVPEDFESMLAFGTCASACLEDYERSAFWYYTIPMGSYYVANNHRRIVDVVGREMSMTARQIAQQFPAENLSSAVREALVAPGGADRRFDVAQLVMPNPEYKPGNRLSKHMRYRSCYYEVNGQNENPNTMLLEEGFETFPIRVARWRTKGNDAWGRGPGHFALGDCKALQNMEYDCALLVELLAKPPTISMAGANFSPLSVLPGANTQATDEASAAGVRAIYQVQFDVEKLRRAIKDHEERIDRRFWVHIFQMLMSDDGGKMTATEIMERANEKRIALTPILRMESEYLTPDLARNIDILGRRGVLPPMPPELRGQPMKLEYKSPLAVAAKMQRAAQVNGHIMGRMDLFALKPEIMDNYDFDEMERGTASDAGVPARYMRDPKKVAEFRAQRAQEQAKAMQAERANMAANTAKTLGDTDTAGKNALTDITAALGEE